MNIPLYETCATKMPHSQAKNKNIQHAVMQLIQTTTKLMISQECEVMLYESDSDNDDDMDDIDHEHVCPSCLCTYYFFAYLLITC